MTLLFPALILRALRRGGGTGVGGRAGRAIIAALPFDAGKAEGGY